MTAMPPLRDILNNTPADAIHVDFNFNTIEAHIGTELINRDGSVAMTGPLSLSGPPTAPQHAVSKQYVDTSAIPVGVIWQYAGAVAPPGWVLCDGAQKTTTDPLYAALFAAIGYAYGGSGTNFNLPNLGGRVPVGRAAGDALFGTLGQAGGNRDAVLVQHAHTVNNHIHDLSNHGHTVSHKHGAFASWGQSANHAHPSGPNTQFTHGQNGQVGHNAVAPGAGNTFQAQDGTATGVAYSDHTHYIDIPQHDGWTGTPTNNGSGGAAPGTDQQGVAGGSQNVQPYVTINFIIRIG